MHTLIVGAGFSGLRIAIHASQLGSVCGTRQQQASLHSLCDNGIDAVVLSGPIASDDAGAHYAALDDSVHQQLDKVTHLVICVGPARHAPLNDPVLRLFAQHQVRLPKLEWVGYLSTIGVYGNHNGEWVDESTPCTSVQSRSIMRREAELGWQSLCEHWRVPLSILRLSGIYGPGRNAIEDAIAGRARMLIKPEQVFNRIHVDDLATAAMLCAQQRHDGLLNITDDLPAPPQDVIRYAHELADRPLPEAVDFATADISDMARSFYGENKRVSNALSKKSLGMQYQYPTFTQGLDALWSEIAAR